MALLNVTFAVLLIVLVLWLILRKQERCFRQYDKKNAEYFLAESQDLQKYYNALMNKMLDNYCELKNALVSPEVLAEHLTNHLYHHFRNLKGAIDLLEDMNENRYLELALNEKNIKSELADMKTEMGKIIEPVQRMAEIQAKQVIKYGESNRNLYLKLSKNKETITTLQKNLEDVTLMLSSKEEELKMIKNSVSDCLAIFVEEIDFMRDWMENRGIPAELLRKELSQHFKQNIPSEEYHKHQDEKVLRKAINPSPVFKKAEGDQMALQG